MTTKSKKYSQLTWPAVIARRLGLEYCCYASQGSGNLQILNNILDQLAQDCNDIYVINWTFINRWDYVYTSNNQWHTILPSDKHDRAGFYHKHFQSDYTDKLNNLIWINTAVQALKAANVKFCMTYMDQLLFESRWHTGPGITKLQKQVEPYVNLFNGVDFLEWSQRNGYAISPEYHHPLEQAHEAAADYLQNHNLV